LAVGCAVAGGALDRSREEAARIRLRSGAGVFSVTDAADSPRSGRMELAFSCSLDDLVIASFTTGPGSRRRCRSGFYSEVRARRESPRSMPFAR